MCVCVFRIHVLKIAIERWFWEVNMLIGSLVKLHVRLHSCLCFSLLEKLLLKASSTPPRYLAICRASSAFSYRNLDSFSTPSGLIKKVPTSSIASRHLVDRLSSCSCIWWFVPRHLLDTCICRRPITQHLPHKCLDTSRQLYLSRFTEALFILLMRSAAHFFQFLSR